MKLNENYWESRYQHQQTGWDIGYISTPLKTYVDQLTKKDLRILIPGGGNGYEAAYLFEKGFPHVYLLDWATAPLQAFQQQYPHFPKKQLLHKDFFTLEGSFDLIIEQTFFCAILPQQREDYARKMVDLLRPNGKLVGVLFNIPLNTHQPPFGGNKKEYQPIFKPYFEFQYFEECYNSIPPRAGNELFILLKKSVENN
ncbi:MAG: methyltransferase [Thermonemataceae bacterium]